MKKTGEKIKDIYSFNEKQHIHSLNGKPLNGITTILGVINKPFLVPWACKMMEEWIKENTEKIKGGYIVLDEQLKEAKSAHTRKKEDAGKKGTDIHETIESIIKTAIKSNKGIIGISNHKEPQVQNFLEWAKENKVKFLDSELRLYSKEYWIGGICDIVCEIDKKVWLADIKTGSGIYPEHFLQMAAYQLMIEERELYKDIQGHIVVNLKKDGSMEVKNNCELSSHREGFLSALRLYRCLNDIK